MMSMATSNSLWQPEFYDILKVLEMGAAKHGAHNWLNKAGGKKSSFKDMHDSMFHHLAESWGQKDRDMFKQPQPHGADRREDEESGLDPLLHLACRALMCYTLIQRGYYEEKT